MGEEKLILLDTDVIIELLDKKSDLGKVLMFRIMESGELYTVRALYTCTKCFTA